MFANSIRQARPAKAALPFGPPVLYLIYRPYVPPINTGKNMLVRTLVCGINCHLLFGVTPCYTILLYISMFTKKKEEEVKLVVETL